MLSGHDIEAVGECLVDIQHNEKNYQLPLVVIKSSKEFIPLMGRNWLNVLYPDWQSNFQVGNESVKQISDSNNTVECLIQRFNNVFDSNLCSPISGFEVRFNIKDNL